MGNILSDDSVSNEDINEVKLITLETSYDYSDPIWGRVFDMKGYLQHMKQSYLNSICIGWSRDMSNLYNCLDDILVKNTLTTHNFEVFIQHMSEVVTEVPRRLLRSVSVSKSQLKVILRMTSTWILFRKPQMLYF